MDQGVICILKAYYRTQLVQRALQDIDAQTNSSIGVGTLLKLGGGGGGGGQAKYFSQYTHII